MKKFKLKLNKKYIIMLISLIAVAIVLVSALNSSVNFSEGDGGNSVISSESGLRFTGNDIIKTEVISSRLLVLTEKQVLWINSKNDVKFAKVHNYSNPDLAVNEGYAVIFNRGSEEFMILDGRGIVYEGKSENNFGILTAYINNEGKTVFSTKSDDSAARIYLLSKKGKKLYEWSCGNEYPVCIDMSSNGRRIALGAIGAKNGVMVAKTYLLDIREEKALCEFSAEGAEIASVKIKGKTIVSTFLNRRLVYDINSAKGAPKKSEFVNSALSVYTDYKGNTAVLTEDVSSLSKSRLTLYGADNRVLYSVLVPEKLNNVFLKGKTIIATGEREVLEINSRGIKKRHSADFDILGSVVLEGKTFVYSKGILTESK